MPTEPIARIFLEYKVPYPSYHRDDYDGTNKYFNAIDWDKKLVVDSVDHAEKFIAMSQKLKNVSFPFDVAIL